MNRYRIRISVDGKRKLYYIEDQENYDIVLLPSKYLKHKADANRSPNTVRRLALSICYYLNYLDQTGTELLQVAKKSFEEQSSHFGQFLYWLVEGRHITDNRTAKTGNGTCNAYLKDVFGFFLYLADNGYTEPLRVLAYNQITVSNAVGVKRTIRSKSFKGYLKEKDRNVRAAQEPEIIDILRACTNLRDQLLLLLLAETGFRIGEILGVDYTKDIDYEKQVLKVYFRDDNDNEARAKNAEYRSAKISRETFEFLLHYLAEYRRLLQRQSLLFINIRGETAGKPMRVESVYDMLDRMEEKTGIMNKYDKMIACNRKASAEKIDLARRTIFEMVEEGEKVTIPKLIAKTGLSRGFFYKNPMVRQALDKALEQQVGMIDPRRSVLDMAMDNEIVALHERIRELQQENQRLRAENEKMQKALSRRNDKLLRNL